MASAINPARCVMQESHMWLIVIGGLQDFWVKKQSQTYCFVEPTCRTTWTTTYSQENGAARPRNPNWIHFELPKGGEVCRWFPSVPKSFGNGIHPAFEILDDGSLSFFHFSVNSARCLFSWPNHGSTFTRIRVFLGLEQVRIVHGWPSWLIANVGFNEKRYKRQERGVCSKYIPP